MSETTENDFKEIIDKNIIGGYMISVNGRKETAEKCFKLAQQMSAKAAKLAMEIQRDYGDARLSSIKVSDEEIERWIVENTNFDRVNIIIKQFVAWFRAHPHQIPSSGVVKPMLLDEQKVKTDFPPSEQLAVEFADWRDEHFELFLSRWEYINNPDRGNWSAEELYTKFMKEKSDAKG